MCGYPSFDAYVLHSVLLEGVAYLENQTWSNHYFELLPIRFMKLNRQLKKNGIIQITWECRVLAFQRYAACIKNTYCNSRNPYMGGYIATSSIISRLCLFFIITCFFPYRIIYCTTTSPPLKISKSEPKRSVILSPHNSFFYQKEWKLSHNSLNIVNS